MKKIVVAVLVLALCCSLFSASLAEETVKLTLWTFQELHLDLYKDMLAKYNEQTDGPKLEIDMQVYPVEEMHQKLTNVLNNGGEGAPDIVDIEINNFANFLKGDIMLAELNDIIEPNADNLVMERMDNYARNGKYYGIDHHIGACVAFYNEELLSSAGIDYKEIKTWDDFAEAGKVLLEKTGKPMTTWEVTDCWSIYPLVSQHGGDWLDAENNVRMDEQVVVDTLQFMRDMLDAGTAVAAPGGSHHMEAYWGWMNAGECGSVVMPFWYTGRFTSYMPDLAGKIKVAPMPTWSDGGYKTAQMGGTGTAVVKTSANLELAKDYLAFATLSYDSALQSWYLLGFDPIRTDVYGGDDLSQPNIYFDYFGDDLFEAVSSSLDSVAPTALTDYYPTATDIVKTKMAYELVETDNDVSQIVAECAQELRDSIE